MVAAHFSPIAAAERPLALRRRADLVTSARWHKDRTWHVVKDPLGLTYYYLSEEEHFLLSQLDGATSLEQIQAAFERRFAPQRLPMGHVQRFLGELHRRGLVISDAPGQAAQLAARGTRRRFGLWSLLERVLSLRIRGFDPRTLLAWLLPRWGWIFGPVGCALWLVTVWAAGALVVTHWGEFMTRLPAVEAMLTADNVVWLSLSLIAVKTLHELGHALAAARLGCQCPDMGVQFFFLLPCLYTNVSDAWLLPSKWQRMAISAAGMYVEMLLAAVALLVWWRAEPGILAAICQNVMLVASIGTLVLNGNPLMRYDGYYLLADWTETPNLESRSRQHLAAGLAAVCLGVVPRQWDALDQRFRPLLAAYAAAAIGYRAAVLMGVYWLVRRMLGHWHLELAGDALLLLAVLGLAMPLMAGLQTQFVQAQRRRELRGKRLAASAAVLAVSIAAALWLPLPQRITAPGVMEAHAAQPVYVTVAGRLIDAVPEGTLVKPGDRLAKLESPELDQDLARLTSEHKSQALHVSHLETLAATDQAAAAGLPAARAGLADLAKRSQQVQALLDRLTVMAPAAGRVLAPPRRRSSGQSEQLESWTGSPLDRENRGCFLSTGTMLCQIAPPGPLEAVLMLEQADVPLIAAGARVRLVVPGIAWGAAQGTVEEISRWDADALPPQLVAAGLVPSDQPAVADARPAGSRYRVRVKVENPPLGLIPGQIARASIAARSEPLVPRLRRWLGRTFRPL